MSTCGTAVGAKQGRTKGNKQEAKYTEPERKHGKPGWKEGEKPEKRKWTGSTEIANCEAKAGRKWKKEEQRLSSEMLRQKRTKESGS